MVTITHVELFRTAPVTNSPFEMQSLQTFASEVLRLFSPSNSLNWHIVQAQMAMGQTQINGNPEGIELARSLSTEKEELPQPIYYMLRALISRSGQEIAQIILNRIDGNIGIFLSPTYSVDTGDQTLLSYLRNETGVRVSGALLELVETGGIADIVQYNIPGETLSYNVKP